MVTYTFEQVLSQFSEVKVPPRQQQQNLTKTVRRGDAATTVAVGPPPSKKQRLSETSSQVVAPHSAATAQNSAVLNSLIRLRLEVWHTLERELRLQVVRTTGSRCVKAYARALEECLYWLHFCAITNALPSTRAYMNDVNALCALFRTQSSSMPSAPRSLVEHVRNNSARVRALSYATPVNIQVHAKRSVVTHDHEAFDTSRQLLDSLCKEAIEDSEYTQVIKCMRCRVGPVRFYCRQTRGADEGMTAFFQCQNCRARWTSS
jgi:DNA-directed RNA polymerase subunit M/transcription elongation factor TFIIS